MGRAKKSPYTQIDSTLENCLDVSGLTDLRDELQDWYDNLHENFQNGQKGEELQEAIEYLSEAENADLELPNSLKHLATRAVSFGVYRKASSRAKRCDDSISQLAAARELLEEAKGEWEDALAKAPEKLPANGELEAVEERAPITQEEMRAAIEDAETLIDALQEICDTCEQVNFPGMY
jgi:tetratricopeptide (TPR) repeat protein